MTSVSWLFSTAFITGYIPSLLLIFCWATLGFLLSVNFSIVEGSQHLDRVEKSTTINPLMPEEPLSEPADQRVQSDSSEYAQPTSRSYRMDAIRMWLMFVVNVFIVGSVNGVYIYCTLQSYLSGYITWIQYSGAYVSAEQQF